jgi:hypothetical protein
MNSLYLIRSAQTEDGIFRRICTSQRRTMSYSYILLIPFKFGAKSEPFKYTAGDRFTKVIVNRNSKITLKTSLRARIRAFH